MNKDIVGWERLPSGNWQPVENQGEGYVITEEFITCNECHRCVSGHGGPRTYVLCIRCFNQVESAK